MYREGMWLIHDVLSCTGAKGTEEEERGRECMNQEERKEETM